jgi:hypothetical protein
MYNTEAQDIAFFNLRVILKVAFHKMRHMTLPKLYLEPHYYTYFFILEKGIASGL